MELENKASLPSPVDMLEDAIREWWRNIVKFVTVYIWSLKFALIPLVLVLAAYASNFWLGGNNSLIRGLISFIGAVIALYVMIRAQIATFLLIKSGYQEKEQAVFQASRALFWPYIKLAVLQALAVLAWGLLLIVPGIIFAIYYSLATYVFFSEDKQGWAAISRSRDIIKGSWWRAAGRLFLLGIFFWAIMTLFSIPLDSWPENSLSWQVYYAFLQGLSLFLGPISLIYCFRLYRELLKLNPQN